MDTESENNECEKLASSNCMENEALLLTFFQGLELGAFAKHNQYCFMKYCGQALSIHLQYTNTMGSHVTSVNTHLDCMGLVSRLLH